MKKRFHVYISGYVQGVFFRANTYRQGRTLGVTGWVRNLPDGRVETVFEGEQEAAETMLAWCRTGTAPAHVSHVEYDEEIPTHEFTDFEIRYR